MAIILWFQEPSVDGIRTQILCGGWMSTTVNFRVASWPGGRFQLQ